MVELYKPLLQEVEKWKKLRISRVANTTIEYQRLILMDYAKYLTNSQINDFQKANKDIIERYLQSKNTGSTKKVYYIVIRAFYDRMYDMRELVNKIENFKSDTKARIQSPEDIITPKDISEAMKGKLQFPVRDKAILITLWESNARANEFLALKIKDVSINDNITTLKIKCEKRRDSTDTRLVDCEMCTPYLQDWLTLNHPNADNPEAPLWIALGYKLYGKPLGYMGLRNICLRALNRTPHIFRHSRSTYLALKGASETQLMSHGGWNRPDMVYHYTKMAQKTAGKSIGLKNGNNETDLDNTANIVKKMQGEFKSISNFQEQKTQLTELTAKVTKMENEMSTQKDFITELMGNPEVQAAMLSAMKSKSVNGDKVLEL